MPSMSADPIDLARPFTIGGWFTKVAVLALGLSVICAGDDRSGTFSVSKVEAK